MESLVRLRVAARRGVWGWSRSVWVDKLAGTPYADGELEAQARREKELAREERKKVSKNRLVAQQYKTIFQTSSLVLFVNGSVTDLKSKAALREIGFKSKRVKSSLIKPTARLLGDDPDHLMYAEAMSRGLTSIVWLENPLMSLTKPGVLEKLESITPVKEPKNAILKPHQFLLAGGYMMDQGKEKAHIWLTKPGLEGLFESLKTNAQHIPQDQVDEIEPHAMFHGKMVAALKNHVGIIRVPLTASAKHMRDTLQSIPSNVSQTFAKIQAKREEEAKP